MEQQKPLVALKRWQKVYIQHKAKQASRADSNASIQATEGKKKMGYAAYMIPRALNFPASK